jgi:hypothetical protein
VENRILELKDNIYIYTYIKGKTRIQNRVAKGICNSIKRPNLQSIGIRRGEEVQAKGTGNMINKIISENLPKFKK